MKAYERFLKYVAVWTASDENSKSVPTQKDNLGSWSASCRRDESTGTFRRKNG